MATLSPTLNRPRTSSSGGGKGPNRDLPGGGGGGGRGDLPNYGEELRRYRLGMAIGLVAVFVLFLVFTGTFLFRLKLGAWDYHTSSYHRDWKPVSLPFQLFAFNTLLLLLSSVSFERARKQAFSRAAIAAAGIPGVKVHDEHEFPWLALTLSLGLAFLIGQCFAWRELMHRGFYLSGNSGSSFVYVLTGMHAIHLVAGILALLYASFFVRWRRGASQRRRIVLDVTSWYWHSMGILWIYILGLLLLL